MRRGNPTAMQIALSELPSSAPGWRSSSEWVFGQCRRCTYDRGWWGKAGRQGQSRPLFSFPGAWIGLARSLSFSISLSLLPSLHISPSLALSSYLSLLLRTVLCSTAARRSNAGHNSPLTAEVAMYVRYKARELLYEHRAGCIPGIVGALEHRCTAPASTLMLINP